MEARRIECRKGHVLAVLKTEEGAEADPGTDLSSVADGLLEDDAGGESNG